MKNKYLFFTVIIFILFINIFPVSSQSSEEWIKKGDEFYGQKKYEDAIICYDTAIKINPKSSRAWVNKGCALYALGKYAEEITCYDKAIGINPENIDAWYNKGCSLYGQKRFEEALDCFNKVIDLSPEDIAAKNNRVRAIDAIEMENNSADLMESEELVMEQIKNTEYTVGKSSRKVKLLDGQYESGTSDLGNKYLKVKVNKVSFGDINNDEKVDAAVICWWDDGSGEKFYNLNVLFNKNGEPEERGWVFLGKNIIIKDLIVDSGEITINMIVPGNEEGSENTEESVTYELKDNELIKK